MTQTVTVTAVNDTADEVNETIILSVDADSITGVNAGTPVSVTATIIDDGRTGSDFSSGIATVTEGTAMVTVTVQLSTSPVVPLTIPLRTSDGTAKAGFDYTALTTETVSFGASTDTLTGTVSISITDDDIDEANESFAVLFGTLPAGVVGGGTPSYVVVAIVDNDEPPTGPVVSLELPLGFLGLTTSITEDAGSAPPDPIMMISVTVRLSEALPDPVSFTISTAGTATINDDYTLLPEVVTIAAGMTSGMVTVVAVDDLIDEAPETIILSVDASSITGVSNSANNSVTITLMDDDDTPMVSFASSTVAASEEMATVNVMMQLSGASAVDLSIPVRTADGTAKAGVDYTALTSTNVIFTAGTTTQMVPITIADDDAHEATDETFTVFFRCFDRWSDRGYPERGDSHDYR